MTGPTDFGYVKFMFLKIINKRGVGSPNYTVKFKINTVLVNKIIEYCDRIHAEEYML